MSLASDISAAIQPPQQERSRASFERVLEAATAVLEEKGYDGFTLAEVSKRAHVSIGSIYARVKSKDDLFYVVQDRFLARAEDRERLRDPDAWREFDAQELVRELVREFGEIFKENERLLRVFMHRAIVDPVVGERSSASVSQFHDEAEAILLTRRAAIVHDDPVLAIDVAFRMAWGTLARQIMDWPTFESHRAVEWKTLVAELGRACAAYLFGSDDGRSSTRRGRRGR